MRKAEFVALLEEESRPVALPRKEGKRRAVSKVTGKETLKDIVEDEAEKVHKEDQEEAEKEQQDNTYLTRKKHEHALNGAYRSFRSPGLPKIDVDVNIEKITPYMRSLTEQQMREMGLAKVQLWMWVKWKKQEEVVIQLDTEEFKTSRGYSWRSSRDHSGKAVQQ